MPLRLGGNMQRKDLDGLDRASVFISHSQHDKQILRQIFSSGLDRYRRAFGRHPKSTPPVETPKHGDNLKGAVSGRFRTKLRAPNSQNGYLKLQTAQGLPS